MDLSLLFDTNGFPARWHCGIWTPVHGWTHIVSDLLIWGAYIAIPISLVVLIRRRDDVPFPRVFWLFVAFILCCGFSHAVEATIFWHPWYRLSALFKVATAVVSWLTVVAIFRVMPLALELPGVIREREELAAEVARRRQVEAELVRSQGELARAAAELERSNKDLERFAATASHDLRAPLRGIRQLAEWVREDEGDNLGSESVENLDMLIRRSARMDQMVAGLLEVARAGGEADSSDVPDLAALVSGVADDLGQAQLSVDIEGDAPPLSGPEPWLRQVLANLLQNAVQHGGDGPTNVVVAARVVDGSNVEIAVEDDGPGVPESDRERVFDLFYTTAPRDDGAASGIGLPTVRRIVERAGGAVRVEASEGGGARFVFSWPRKA